MSSTATKHQAVTLSCRACNGSREYPELKTLEEFAELQREFFAEHECPPTPAPLPGWVKRQREAEAALLTAEARRERMLNR